MEERGKAQAQGLVAEYWLIGLDGGENMDRQHAMNLLIADGWDKIGAEVILDTCEEQEFEFDEAGLLRVSADYKDR